jgi:phage terminase large subunit
MSDPFAVTVGGAVVYEPFDKQREFHSSRARYRLFGGSKGCGKSLAVRWDHHLFCLSVPGAQTLIVRRKLTELQRSHLRYIPKDMQAMGGEAVGFRWRPSEVGAGVLYYPNGSLTEFGHVQHEDDVETYLSAAYERISQDELVTFTEYQHLMLCSCLRTTIPGVTPQFGAATNPGGPQAQWVKRRWIDQDVTADEDEVYDAADYHYIPALPKDNPHLNWIEYERELRRLPPEMRRAYLEGDWNIFLGQFFPEFRRALHVLDGADLARYGALPAVYLRDAAMDWGYAHEGVILWFVLAEDGTLIVDDEYVFNGPRRDKLVAGEVARAARERVKERGWRVRRWLADPKMADQTGHDGGETHLDTFRRNGVPLHPADNDRVNGWGRVRAWLRTNPATGKPFLRVHPRCQYLIRTLGAVLMDSDRPEDVDTDGPDHACDALRYFLMGRPSPARDQPTLVYPPGTVGWLKRQALREQEPRERVLGASNRSHRSRFAGY